MAGDVAARSSQFVPASTWYTCNVVSNEAPHNENSIEPPAASSVDVYLNHASA